MTISKGFKVNKNPNDALCQLRSIGCIISQDNIWANVQSYEDPGLLNFDLDNTKCWKPFFTKTNFKKYFPLEKITPL